MRRLVPLAELDSWTDALHFLADRGFDGMPPLEVRRAIAASRRYRHLVRSWWKAAA